MAGLRQTNQRVTLVMLVLASITVITLDYRGEASHAITHVRNGIADALSPFQRVIAAALHPLGDVVSSTFHYGQLQAQNTELRDQVGHLEQQLAAQAYAESRSSALFALDNLPFAPNVARVAAQVISQGTSDFAPEVEIDRGSDQGVGVGMPVVSGAGLIGTVVEAAGSTSWVQLVTSPHSSIGVEDPHTGIYLERGNGAGRPLSIPTTTPSPPPHVGDLIMTSGEDAGAFPPAIPVGTVRSVHPVPGGLSSEVTITPAVDLGSLQYVAVLQWLQPA
jgi:rod shape-determining protein MreC